MAYGQIAAGIQTKLIPMKTRKAPKRSDFSFTPSLCGHSFSRGFLAKYNSSEPIHPNPSPIQEAGKHMIDQQPHTKADQDTGRNNESTIAVLLCGFR